MSARSLGPPVPAPSVRASRTSVAAAASLSDAVLGRLEGEVFDCIRDGGGLGRTDDELEVLLHLSHQTVSARRRGLVQKGRVRDSGLERKTRSGRRATVWMLGKETPVAGAPMPGKVARPSDEEIKRAVQTIRTLASGNSKGYSADLGKLCDWLLWISEEH